MIYTYYKSSKTETKVGGALEGSAKTMGDPETNKLNC